MSSSMPKTIKIGPMKYQVEPFNGIDPDSGGKLDGLQCYYDSKVLIRKGLKLVPRQITLIHEILHCIFDNVAIDFNEENHKIISLISPALLELLKDNPELVNFLTKK